MVLIRPEVIIVRFEKIVAPTISELFESKMQHLILSGELTIDEKLPSERILAEEMGISKSAVHLGMRNLERTGFVRIDPRQGAYVANWEENGNLETLTALLKTNVLKLEPENIRSLILVRESLESDAMEVFAGKHTNADILQIRSYACEIRDGAKRNPPMSVSSMAELAFMFSHYIFLHSGNMFSSLILNSFKPFTLGLWEEWILSIGPDAAADYLDRTAIELRDGNAKAAIGIVHQYNSDLLEKMSQQ